MAELGKFIVGDPDRQPADIDALAKEHKGFRNIPIIYTDANGVHVAEFTSEVLMQAFCTGRDPKDVSDQEFREALENIAAGRSHSA